MINKKGQVSIELLIIIGFILVFFIPLLALSYFKIIELNNDLAQIQSEVAVSRISNAMNSIGWMGSGSSLIMDIYLPPGAELNMQSSGGGGEISIAQNLDESESLGITWFNIDSDNPNIDVGGNYRFNLTSSDNLILVRSYD